MPQTRTKEGRRTLEAVLVPLLLPLLRPLLVVLRLLVTPSMAQCGLGTSTVLRLGMRLLGTGSRCSSRDSRAAHSKPPKPAGRQRQKQQTSCPQLQQTVRRWEQRSDCCWLVLPTALGRLRRLGQAAVAWEEGAGSAVPLDERAK